MRWDEKPRDLLADKGAFERELGYLRDRTLLAALVRECGLDEVDKEVLESCLLACWEPVYLRPVIPFKRT